MKYLAYDGKSFNTEQECLEHEKKLDADTQKEQDAIDKLRELEQEFNDAEKKFKNGLAEFYSEYNYLPLTFPADSVLPALIRSVFPWM